MVEDTYPYLLADFVTNFHVKILLKLTTFASQIVKDQVFRASCCTTRGHMAIFGGKQLDEKIADSITGRDTSTILSEMFELRT